MRNPFEKPQSLTQWLGSSVCWVGSCLVGFNLLSWGVLWLWSSDSSLFLVFGVALVVCVLMWRRVISVGWRQLSAEEAHPTWLSAVAALWLLVLTGVFVASSASLAFGTMILLALTGESGGGGWN